jgi:2-dehydropantoate 2-reductase
MRVLVVGAGAIGGYFGGRMLSAGRDITFLVRPKRAAELAGAGLVIKSPHGDVTLKNPPTVQADKLTEKFDVVLLSCKAFDLEDAIKSFAPAVGPRTSIIPLLNGMNHLDALDAKFGTERVLGGLCAIAATLNEAREVVQLAPMQSINFGERDGQMSDRVRAILEVFASGNFGAVASEHIMQDMWEKWVFLASLAASTCLMRTSVGNILAAPGGKAPARDGRRNQRNRKRRGLCARRAVLRTRQGHTHRGRLADDRLDVPRHPGGATGRGRSRDRRSRRPRRCGQNPGSEAAHRLYASQGLRKATRIEHDPDSEGRVSAMWVGYRFSSRQTQGVYAEITL